MGDRPRPMTFPGERCGGHRARAGVALGQWLAPRAAPVARTAGADCELRRELVGGELVHDRDELLDLDRGELLHGDQQLASGGTARRARVCRLSVGQRLPESHRERPRGTDREALCF